jgi:hypothetical protein
VAVPLVLAARGDIEGLLTVQHAIGRHSWTQVAHAESVARAIVERETGAESGALGEACNAIHELIVGGSSEVPALFAEAIDCAFAAGETGRADDLLAAVDELKPAQLIPLLEAEATRARARLAVHRGEDEEADELFRRAIAMFGDLETPFYLARTQLEYAEFLSGAGRDMGTLRDEAHAVFESLGAKPWLARAQALATAVAA